MGKINRAVSCFWHPVISQIFGELQAVLPITLYAP